VAPKLFGGPPRHTPLDHPQVLSMNEVPELIEISRRDIGMDTLISGLVPSSWLDKLLNG
jgi:hypothetical protein